MTGAIEPDIARVEVRYTTAAGFGRGTASLVHVDGPVPDQVRLLRPG